LIAAILVAASCEHKRDCVVDATSLSGEPELPPAEPGYRLVDWRPAWAPSGDRIAYDHRSEPGEPGGIYEVRLDQFRRPIGRRLVVQPNGEVNWLRYSPDSGRLVFCMSADMHILDMSTGEVTQATHVRDGQSPDWHPDGRHIIYNRVSGGGYYPEADSGGLRIVDIDTWVDEPLRLRGGRVVWGGAARMAHDGRRVVYTVYQPETGGLELMLYSPDLEVPMRLTSTGWTCHNPRWFKNDTQLLFSVEVPIFDPDPWYSVPATGGESSPYLRADRLLNLGREAVFNPDDTMFVLTARDTDSEDGVLWIREVGTDGLAGAWQVTDYR
jgi:hypothetical protein